MKSLEAIEKSDDFRTWQAKTASAMEDLMELSLDELYELRKKTDVNDPLLDAIDVRILMKRYP